MPSKNRHTTRAGLFLTACISFLLTLHVKGSNGLTATTEQQQRNRLSSDAVRLDGEENVSHATGVDGSASVSSFRSVAAVGSTQAVLSGLGHASTTEISAKSLSFSGAQGATLLQPDGEASSSHLQTMQGERHPTEFAASEEDHATSASLLSETESGRENPWMVGERKAFMDRFNIPVVHGSGIYIDLGREASGYREVSGRCPVFGKGFSLFRPGGPVEDFLGDFPASGTSERPFSGGFNLGLLTSSGKKISPITDDELKATLGASAPSTAIGRCARFAYETKVLKPNAKEYYDYRMPFIFDTQSNICYILQVTTQDMWGPICSIDGVPRSRWWCCYYPVKSKKLASFVFGSAYVGEDPDAWTTKCPNKAVRNALFGEWKDGKCVPYSESSKENTVDRVNGKEECWVKSFGGSSIDLLMSENEGDPDNETDAMEWKWPKTALGSSLSRGIGRNYSNYREDGNNGGLCITSMTIPTCLLSSPGSVAYTALGSLEEEDLPLLPGAGGGDSEGRSEGGRVNPWVIAGGVLGALLLVGIIGGGAAMYHRRKSSAKQEAERADGAIGDAERGGESQRRATEANVATDESFWKGEGKAGGGAE